MVGIYKITSPSGKIYIGQSWNIEERLYRYTCSPKRHIQQTILYNSLMKYGAINHQMEIIHELPSDVSQEVLDEYETFYINQCVESGFKMLNIKDGGRGGKHSEESKLKMSVSHTGKKLSEEHVEKIVNANTGKKRSQEYKDRMSELHTGKVQSEETKKKISEIKKEFFKTKEVHNKGKKLDEVGRKILSDASTCKIPVVQLDLNGNFIKEWSFIKEAERELGILHVDQVCKGKQKTAGGFRWQYKEPK